LRAWLGRAGLLGASTLAALLIIEMALRLFGGPPPPPEDTLRTYTEHDPDLGWRGRAGASGAYRTDRFDTSVRLNSGGWRDDEPRQGDRRILLLGDSFAWGYGVNRGEMFADRVEEMLPGWEVRNYGLSGYGTDQELLVLRSRAPADRPAVVIVEFAAENDIQNILTTTSYHLPKPRFVLRDGALHLEGVPVPRTENWERVASGDALKEFLTLHLRLFTWARPRWAALQARVLRLLGRGGDDVAATRRMRQLAKSPGEKIDGGWKLEEALLGGIREEAAKVGAKAVILDVPDPLQVDDDLWKEAVAAFGLNPDDYDRGLPARRIADIGGRFGMPVVETLEQLKAKMRAGESVYLPGDIHWNARGHAVAAEELVKALREILPHDGALAHP
jgi:hypothetical protein